MERRRVLMDLLSNLVAFLVFFNIFAFVFALSNGYGAWIYLLLAVPFFFMMFLRAKIKKMRYFLAIHFVMLAAPFATLHNIWLFIPFMCFAAAVTIYSLHRKGKGEWAMQGTSAVWVIAVFAGLSLLYAAYFPEMESAAAILLNISSLISLAAVVLYMHMDNMWFGLRLVGEHHKKSENISSVSNVLITVFLIIIVIFGGLSVLFPSQAAIMVLGRLLIDIILLPFEILGFIFRSISGEPEFIGDLPFEQWFVPGEAMEIDFDEELQTSPIHAIIGAIVGFLAVLGLVAIAVAILATLFYRLYKALGKKSETDKMSLMPEDAVSKLKFVLGDFKELLPRFRLGTKHPVRREYIKKINSHIKQGLKIQPHYTPEIIADKIRPKEDIDELTQRYEEVRYGKI